MSARRPGRKPRTHTDHGLEGTVFVTLGPGSLAREGSGGRWRLDPLAHASLLGLRSAELRLDLLPELWTPSGEPDPSAVRELVEELRRLLPSTQLLATCQAAAGAGGAFTGTDEQRLMLLAAAVLAGVDLVDLDLAWLERLGQHELLGHLLEGRAGVVLSAHPDPGEWGTTAELLALLDARLASGLELARQHPAAVDGIKLVPTVASGEEGLELLAWLRRRWAEHGGPDRAGPELAVFAAGEAGAATRHLAPAFGSSFHYGAAPTRSVAPAAAPGQLDVDALCDGWVGLRPPEVAEDPGVVLAVLGHPVGGSLSPQLFTRLLEWLGQPGVYGRLDLADPEAAFRLASELGLRGLSVTAPHKASARRFARNGLSPALRGLGAVNTLVRASDPDGTGAGYLGANTDLVGVRAALDELFDVGPAGGFASAVAARPEGPLVVLGAGGAARAAVAAVRSWPDASCVAGLPLVVLARDPRSAAALAREFGAAFGGLEELGGLRPLALVHATTAGSAASPDPAAPWCPGPAALADLAARAPDCRVLDANYRPRPTPLVAAARALGLRAADGRRWFLAQALAQLELFLGAPALEARGAEELGAQAELELDSLLARADEGHAGVAPGSRASGDPVVLVGQRGTGKTTVAALLAEALGAFGEDLDEALLLGRPEDSAGEVLLKLGEPRFRDLELANLELRLAGRSRLEDRLAQLGRRRVLALGGGAVETPRVRELLAGARVVWLRAEARELAERLEGDGTLRPPLAAAAGASGAQAEAEAIAAQRDPLYASVADLEVETTGLAPAAVVERVLEGLAGLDRAGQPDNRQLG